MNWRYKGLLHRVFSLVPFGTHAHHFFQRRITRSIPPTDEKFLEVAGHAAAHISAVRKHWPGTLDQAVFFEFGAGWTMIGPLCFWGFGVNRQMLIDIRRLTRPYLIRHSLEQCRRLGAHLGFERGHEIMPGRASFLEALRQAHGIHYLAPCDARTTPFPTRSIDCITSTNTLEHIPPDDVYQILTECHRLLRPGGIASMRIDYQDHYSYFDSGITPYNFLHYSDRRWKLFNPPSHYQNRLRHSEYLRTAEAAGFEVLQERRTEGTATDRAAIEALPIDTRFRRFSTQELAVRNAHLVLRKP